MSMPNVPDITPEITLKREEVNNLLLSSIALEEISFSHIVNAEAEKIQHFLKSNCLSLEQALRLNDSVERVLRSIVSNQILLQFKLMDIARLGITEEECWGKYEEE